MKEPLNGICARVNDARLLWNHGRREGAFLNALIAVAALSRQLYPAPKDREAFEKCFADFRGTRIGVEFRGECHQIEHIFYKWMRCNLVHEAELPPDIQFAEDEADRMSVRAGGPPEFVLKIGTGWFFHILESVQVAVK